MGLSSMVSPTRAPQNPNFQQIYKHHIVSGCSNFEDLANNPATTTTTQYSLNDFTNNQIHNRHMVKKESSPSPSCLSSSSSSSPPAPPPFAFAPIVDRKEELLLNQKQPNAWGEVVNQEQSGGFGQSSFQELLLRGFDADVADLQMMGAVDPMAAAVDWGQFPRERQIELLHVGNRALLGGAAAGNGSVMEVGFPNSQLAGDALVGNSAGMERKRRMSDEVMDKTIERKQRRMIKNRESAARSRAKKQAYTNNLEEQVSQLRRANKMLMNEKELAALFPLEPKPQLRRTTSSVF